MDRSRAPSSAFESTVSTRGQEHERAHGGVLAADAHVAQAGLVASLCIFRPQCCQPGAWRGICNHWLPTSVRPEETICRQAHAGLCCTGNRWCGLCRKDPIVGAGCGRKSARARRSSWGWAPSCPWSVHTARCSQPGWRNGLARRRFEPRTGA